MKIRSIAACAALAVGASLAAPARAGSTFDEEIALFTRLLGLEPGSVVADIGAGDGEFAIALAPGVGETGRVYATEIEADDREDIAEAAEQAGADNLVVAEARIEGTGLEPGCCDAVLLRTVYHHLTRPEPFAASLFATIRPGGRLVVVDFRPSFWLGLWTPEGIPEDRGGHGVPPEIVVRELEAAGFRRVETVDPWPTSGFITKTYGIAFERPAE